MHDVEVTVGKLKGYALSLNWTNTDTGDALISALDPNRYDNHGSYHMAYLRVHNALGNMYEAVVLQKTMAEMIGVENTALVKFYDYAQGLGVTNETLEEWRQEAMVHAGIG